MHMTYLLAIVQCTGPTGLVLYVPEQPPKTKNWTLWSTPQ